MSSRETIDKTVAALTFACFVIIWVVIWRAVCWDRLSTSVWLWIPFLFGTAYLVFAGAHATISPLSYEEADRDKAADKERSLLRWVTDYLTALVFGITVVMLVGVQLSSSPGQAISKTITSNATLLSFYRFEFLALGFLLVFVFPMYWFSNEKLGWLRWARHFKTASYILAIFFCLAGVVELASHLLIAG